ncbi:BatA domain-containing protein [Gramella sp. MAR_2010_147]|uniref:BatA domain-containing protein n=1 Tax=Gramella sp. MAR_2010_147 TaxID=1250205 RepID=UPI00087DA10F|nr:BatA domain-containing protein [Gramella sp. MAR_2010_147]SDR71475.1 N-terminal double-transmembrane domain-containing protein [Gramella sp. MAR_2010_147]
MVFLNPTYLWALLGLAVPIAIHLWSKKESRTIKMGSIQFFKESDPKKTSSISINEWWLLVLRILIIGILACILAEPALQKKKSKNAVVYLIEPSIALDADFKDLVDSLDLDHDLRLLQKGFPDLEREDLDSANNTTPDYWQLSNQMEKLSADSIVVFTRALVAGIKGKRPEINKKINLIIVNSENSKSVPVEARRKENGVQLISMLSDDKHIKFEKEIVSENDSRFEINNEVDSVEVTGANENHRLALKEEIEINVQLFYSDSLTKEAHYIESAFSAISKYLDADIKLSKTRNRDSLKIKEGNPLIWLSDESPVKSSGSLLIYRPDSLANALIEPGAYKNSFYLTSPINAENIVEKHLAEKLIGFLDLHKGIDQQVQKNDTRVMDRVAFLPIENLAKIEKNQPVTTSVSYWFWIILAILLIGERALAAYRKQ